MNARPVLRGTYESMLQRCYNPKRDSYPKYGGRGIKVCARWHVFANFEADMSPRPPNTSLDRIDNDGDYEPSNCRWATRTEQSLNRSSNVILELDGVRQPAAVWERQLGFPRAVLSRRRRRGWSDREILTTPLRTPNDPRHV